MERVVQILKAAGDENRLRVLMMLLIKPLCVCEILEVLEIKGGTLSAHLKLLRNAGLINKKKEGRWIIYSLASGKTKEYLTQLKNEIRDPSILIADENKINSISPGICSILK